MNIRQLFDLPDRTPKPRETGVTMVIDSGLGLTTIRGYLDNCGEFVDYVKLGWGTALVSASLEQKIGLYREYGVPVCLGGTFFEFAHLHRKVRQYRDLVRELGLEIVEVSDGTVTMSTEEKLDYIRDFARDFKVLSEYGSKDAEVVVAPSKWVAGMKREFEAGAWKCIAEGRESGTVGLYRPTSELRTGLVEEIVEHIPQANMLWEAPQKAQQSWFVKAFGSNVNLGNITMADVIPLETLRLGLRGDTMMTFHGHRESGPTSPQRKG
jgi:phosphosulfolactate synthase